MKLKGKNLKIEDIVKVSRENEKVELDKDSLENVEKNRKVVEKLIEREKPIYGVTTGIGELAEVSLPKDKIKKFQKKLIYSHSAGCGEPADIEDVRAAFLTRLNTLMNGNSGVRKEVVERIKEILNKGVTPMMCQKGSVGASGDLAPLAQGALVLMGEGKAFYRGEKISGEKAMERAGIETLDFEAKDGLGVINGSNLITGMGSIQTYDSIELIKKAEIAAALTLEALMANMEAFDDRIHKARGYESAVTTAKNIKKLVKGSEILEEGPKNVQDAYSLRSIPQVYGAARDSVKFSREMFETEMNGVADNPLFFQDEGGTCLTGANFQGTPLAFALELLGTAMTTMGVMSERRFNRLTNPNLSEGLPSFLIEGAGMNSGMMLAQYTSASLVCENRVLSTPAATGSIPTAADQEDFVSMGMTTAIKTKDIIKNFNTIISIEMMGAAQALEFRKPLKPGKGTEEAYKKIREYIKPLDEDRPLYKDINCLKDKVSSGKILESVENEIGKLE